MDNEQSSDPLIGTVIDGKYQILEKLGSGGMGSVYKAKHSYLNKTVTLKILHKHLAKDEAYLERFKREARTVCQLRNHNAVTVHDFGVDGAPYVAMEFIEGNTLGDIIKNEGPLDLVRTEVIVRQICHALAEAHASGIVHRDLKPDNIMLAVQPDGTEHVYVLDFGIAKILEVGNDVNMTLTRVGEVMGTPKYMAPEQALQEDVDTRADIYALGVIIYQMLSNCLPFEAKSVMDTMFKHITAAPKPLIEVNPEVEISKAVNGFVMKLLSKKPQDRPQSVEALLTEMDKALSPSFEFDSTGSGSFILEQSASPFPMVGVVAAVVVLGLGLLFFFGRADLSKSSMPKRSSTVAKKEARQLESAALVSPATKPSSETVKPGNEGEKYKEMLGKKKLVKKSPKKKEPKAKTEKKKTPTKRVAKKRRRKTQQRAEMEAEQLRRDAERWKEAERVVGGDVSGF